MVEYRVASFEELVESQRQLDGDIHAIADAVAALRLAGREEFGTDAGTEELRIGQLVRAETQALTETMRTEVPTDTQLYRANLRAKVTGGKAWEMMRLADKPDHALILPWNGVISIAEDSHHKGEGSGRQVFKEITRFFPKVQDRLVVRESPSGNPHLARAGLAALIIRHSLRTPNVSM